MRLLIAILLTVSSAVAADVPAILAEFDKIAAADLWPGFDAKKIPTAIYDGQSTWLRNHLSPPPEFRPVDGRPDLRVFPGLYPAVRANTSVKIGDTLTATVMLDPKGGLAPREAAALIAHEAFHVYQRVHHPTWQGNEAVLFTYPVDDEQAAALGILEVDALRRALTGANAACWTSRFAATRRQRFAMLPAEATAYERLTELNEGLAQYVQNRAAGVAPDLSQEFGPAEIRPRAYATGAAQAVLLDRLAPGWKTRVQDSLDKLAPPFPAACDFSPAERSAATAKAHAQVASVVAKRIEIAKTFDNSPGWRVVVEADPAHPLMPAGFDPSNVENLGGGRILHARWLKAANQAGSAEAINRRSVTTAAGTHPLFQGIRKWTILVDEKPVVKNTLEAIAITAPGLELRFEGAGVAVDVQTITVRLP